MSRMDSKTGSMAGTTTPYREPASSAGPQRMIAAALIAGAVVIATSACSGTKADAPTGTTAASKGKTVNIAMVGKIDADKGPAGTFTSKEHWPAMAPSEIKATKGDTIVLTIKEYDDAPSELPVGSPYGKVAGGTETVNGAAVTDVANADIAHTFTIPELGINAPLPKAPEGGVSTIVFTFKVDKSGTFVWQCLTPCGSDPKGMGGAMATDSWMKGHLTIA